MLAALKNSTFLLLSLTGILISSCKKDQAVPQETSLGLIEVPQGFPPIPFPSNNAFTEARWNLGKKLFFEKALSIDSSISCASCHLPELAFADLLAFSPGVFNRPGVRNAPSLANVAYQPYYLREGSVSTLEMQVLVPIQEENEFAHNIVDIAQALVQNPEYVKMSEAAYQRLPDPYVITRAIATFERTLVSGNSPYDLYKNGSTSALNQSEKRGEQLFFSSKTNCSQCHNGFNFTDYGFANNGLDTVYTDVGRMRFTFDEKDESTFKTPSLRNAELTAPYMHNGSIKTLKEVVEHYNTGGKPHKNKSPIIKPLQLNAQEKQDLVAFLKSLTDYTFINNKNWKNK